MAICSVDFDPAQGLEANQVQLEAEGNDSLRAISLFDNCCRLEIGVKRSYLFKVVATSGSKPGRLQAGDDLGTASFTWRKACGEVGRMQSSLLICPDSIVLSGNTNRVTGKDEKLKPLSEVSPNTTVISGLAKDRQAKPGQKLPVTTQPIDPPALVQMGQPFRIEFLVVNHSEKYMTLQVQFRMEQLIGVSVCGPSFKNLDEVPGNGGSVRVAVRFIALTAGLLKLRGCYIADLSTGFEIPQSALCNILVVTET